MKYNVLTYCKYLLFGAALLPTTVIAFVMLPLLTWPWRIGVMLPFIVLLLWWLFESLKRALEKKGAQPQPVPEAAPAQPGLEEPARPGLEEPARPGLEEPARPGLEEPARQDRVHDLQRSWREAVHTLRSSHLKQEGDPLHVLPWYLVLGAGGSGKTSAVGSARLLSPFVEGSGEKKATANCAWHFYDQGIVIDTAGRYAVPRDPASDHDEWCTFLSLLKKYRRTELINGVIITVAADTLAGQDARELEDLGRQLRCRMDEMIRSLGINFPVYLLVTKCDLIGGMSEFCAELPPESLDQPMGLLNRELDRDTPRILASFWASIDERLRLLRLLLLHRASPTPPSGRLLLFPDRLRALRPGLDLIVQAAFAENHYQETPLLRGIYLCSARPPASAPLARNQAQAPADGHAAFAPNGVFLHDFFEKILPRDRDLWAPSGRAIKWRRLADNLALVCWLLLGASLCALLTVAFVMNVRVMREAASLAASAPQLRGEVAADLASLERARVAITELERKNRNWWVPRFGLTRSREIEEALKRRYCLQYREHLLARFDGAMATAVDGLDPALPDHAFGALVLHLSRRCNLLKARQAGDDLAALSTRPLPEYQLPALQAREWSDPLCGNLYLSYVAWRSDADGVSRELQRSQSLLKRLVQSKGEGLSWLIGYVDRQQPTAAVTLRDFWSGSLSPPAEPTLAPSFTRKGKECIVFLLEELSAAYPDPGVLERQREEFLRGYREAGFIAWQQFAAQLQKGEQRLLAPKEWQVAAAAMAGEQGPYFSFMRKALAELQPFDRNEPLPGWIAGLYRFQALKGAGPAGVASGLSGQASRVAGSIRGMGGKKENLPDNGPGPSGGKKENLQDSDQGANLAREYLNAVAQIAPVAKSRTLAHRMALQAFSESGEAGKSPLFQAAETAQRLNQLLARGQGDDTFASLIYGPITFYGTYIRMETACALQAQWEQQVLKEAQGGSDARSMQYLLGKDGPVWKYVGDYANPFIGWSPVRGYYPKSALGGSIPFKPEFYRFLAQGGKARIASAAAAPKPVYQVTIKGLPTDANAEARIKPQGTRLELHCATGPQVMANMNYPVSKPFVWTPDSCGDVVFQIEVGDTVLTRRYPGSRGFTDFLHDFPAGRHTFYPRNFPHEKQALEGMGIRFIKVNYQMFGAGDISSGEAESLPARIPVKITECWD